MSQADLLAEFDPLFKPATGPLSNRASPDVTVNQIQKDVVQRAQARQQAIVAPLQSELLKESMTHARYPASNGTRQSPPRRLSANRSGRGSFGEQSALSTSTSSAAAPAREAFNPLKQRRRSSMSTQDFSDFVSALSSPTSPPPTASTSKVPPTRSPPPREAFSPDASFSSALHTAMHSEIANDFVHSAQALGSSLRNGWQATRSSTLPPARSPSDRPALANLFSESTFAAPAEKPKRSMTYVSGAPGVNFSEQQNWNKGHWKSSPADPPAPVELLGRRPNMKYILTHDLADGLRPSLPTRLRIANSWTLLYSLDQHGVSLSTLYARVEQGMAGLGSSIGCVLVVQDTEGALFGAFSNEALKKREGYYGSGECFLWKAKQFQPGDIRIGMGVKAFRWTGRNEYMNLCDNDYISFGGGDGRFGLWIDAAFENGLSSRSLTFDNEVLNWQSPSKDANAKEEGRFEVFKVEVWRCGS